MPWPHVHAWPHVHVLAALAENRVISNVVWVITAWTRTSALVSWPACDACCCCGIIVIFHSDGVTLAGLLVGHIVCELCVL